MRKLAPLFSLCLLVFLAPSVAAQTSPIIEQGDVTFTGSSANPQGRFAFTGPQLLVLTGGLLNGNFNPSCGPCVGGQVIHISSIFSGSTSIRPGEMIEAREVRNVYYSGNLTFDSTPVTLPIRFNRYPLKIVVPITLNGQLEVHSSDPFSNPNLLFQIPLSLQGKATLTLKALYIDFLGRPVYQFLGLTYDFPRPQVSDEINP